MQRVVIIGLCLALAGHELCAAEVKKMSPKEVAAQYTVQITSSRDGSEQPALFYRPEKATDQPVPLLVVLHTWSTRFSMCTGDLPFAKERGWVLVAPDFRGENSRPQACASALAVQDVLDAVEYAKKHARVDTNRVYLIGGSGGGHMALVMASKAPQLWAGVSAWVPISDLAAWHAQTAKLKYSKMVERCCGGPPGPATDAEYRARSPLHHLPAARGLPLDINTGIHDGHRGSVPVSQSLLAFNALAPKPNQIAEVDIAFMVEKEAIPSALAKETENDPDRKLPVLFRRVAGQARITVFEGGHDVETAAGIAWLARQRKGQPADFRLPAASEAVKQRGAEQVAH